MVVVIKNIKDPYKVGSGGIKNVYRGRYAQIFDILNEDAIFYEWETTEEILIGNDFYLKFKEQPDGDKIRKIKGLKDVEVILNKNYSIGGL